MMIIDKQYHVSFADVVMHAEISWIPPYIALQNTLLRRPCIRHQTRHHVPMNTEFAPMVLSMKLISSTRLR